MRGYRKLIAFLLSIAAAMTGAIYMSEMMFVSFATLLGTGLGIFSYANVTVHKNTDYENDIEPDVDPGDRIE